jgi:phosphatidylethanolamine/phosphatidyl-N-methylethanolamine N-methyltransferase
MRQQWSDYRVFWREFRRTYHDTGAVMPSGPGLARALCRYVRGDLDAAAQRNGSAGSNGTANRERRILEVGPGTGAVTGAIVAALRPDDRLDMIELNETFVARLRKRLVDDEAFCDVASQINLIHGSIEDLPEDRPYDLIVSGLPFNNFSPDLVEQILDKLRRLLASGGTLSFFEYVAVRKAKLLVSSRRERTRLGEIGRVLAGVLGRSEIHRDLVLANVPPAWVHHVRFSG